MFKITATILFCVLSLFGGTITGELIYSGGGMGAYAVVAIGPSVLAGLAAGDSIDYSSLPVDIIFSPGPYSIDGEFIDSIPYVLFGMKLEDMSVIRPQSGDPMGIFPDRVFTSGGNAAGIDIELDTAGAIGGHITYSGDIEDVKLNVLDIMNGAPVLESVHSIGISPDYSITIPSGFKFLDFFVDINGNDIWDIDEHEPGIRYMGIDTATWGPVVFAGGGDRFATGVDPIIPSTYIQEKYASIQNFALSCTPNPFNSIGVIRYSAPEKSILTIADVSGKIIEQSTISGDGEITFGKNLSSGIYLISMKNNNNYLSKTIFILK